MKTPWMKWFPADWRSDPKLRACSPLSRYVWMEMLGLMHEAEPYGHLLLNGRSPTVIGMSRIFQVDASVIADGISELLRAGVATKRNNVIVSEEMIARDEPAAVEKRPWVPNPIKRDVFTRDGRRCVYCGCESGPFELDHVIPYSRGGGHSFANLVVSCKPCNRDKGALMPEEWQ